MTCSISDLITASIAVTCWNNIFICPRGCFHRLAKWKKLGMPCVVLGYILLAIGTIFLVRPCSV